MQVHTKHPAKRIGQVKLLIAHTHPQLIKAWRAPYAPTFYSQICSLTGTMHVPLTSRKSYICHKQPIAMVSDFSNISLAGVTSVKTFSADSLLQEPTYKSTIQLLPPLAWHLPQRQRLSDSKFHQLPMSLVPR